MRSPINKHRLSIILLMLCLLGAGDLPGQNLKKALRVYKPADYHVFEVTARDCEAHPFYQTRKSTGFKLAGDSTIITALHGVCGCENIMVKSKQGAEVHEFRIVAANANGDVARIYSPDFRLEDEYSDMLGFQAVSLSFLNEQVYRDQEAYENMWVFGKAAEATYQAIGKQDVNLVVGDIKVGLDQLLTLETAQGVHLFAMDSILRYPRWRTLVFRAERAFHGGYSGGPLCIDQKGAEAVIGVLIRGDVESSSAAAYTFFSILPETLFSYGALKDAACDSCTVRFKYETELKDDLNALIKKTLNKDEENGALRRLVKLETDPSKNELFERCALSHRLSSEKAEEAYKEAVVDSQKTVHVRAATDDIARMAEAIAGEHCSIMESLLDSWRKENRLWKYLKQGKVESERSDYESSLNSRQKHPKAFYYASVYHMLICNDKSIAGQHRLKDSLEAFAMKLDYVDVSDTKADQKFNKLIEKHNLPQVNVLVRWALAEPNYKDQMKKGKSAVRNDNLEQAIEHYILAAHAYPYEHIDKGKAFKLLGETKRDLETQRNLLIDSCLNIADQALKRRHCDTAATAASFAAQFMERDHPRYPAFLHAQKRIANCLSDFRRVVTEEHREVLEWSFRKNFQRTFEMYPISDYEISPARYNNEGDLYIDFRFQTVREEKLGTLESAFARANYPRISIGSYNYQFAPEIADMIAESLATFRKHDPDFDYKDVKIIIRGTADGLKFRRNSLQYQGEFGDLSHDLVNIYQGPLGCQDTTYAFATDFLSGKHQHRFRRIEFRKLDSKANANVRLSYLRGLQLKFFLLHTPLFQLQEGLTEQNIDVVATPFNGIGPECRRVEVHVQIVRKETK